MKTFLNILPPEKKEDLRLERRYRLLLRQEMGIFFLIFFLAILLSGIWLLLIMGERSVMAQNVNKEQNSDHAGEVSRKEVFSRVQVMVPLVQKVTDNQRKVSWLFRSLERGIVEGISLSLISAEGSVLKISGHADTRDTLLHMQENIQSTECFSQVVIPWSQIAEKEDIDFEVTVSVDPKCFLLKNDI